MQNGADETKRRLERLLADASRTLAPRPIQADAPLIRARRAIRVRYAVIAASFVALTIVLTASTVVAREIVSDRDGPTGGTATGPTTTSPTIAPPPTVSITSGPQDPTNDPAATFAFTLDGTDRARCTLNGSVLDRCESGMTIDASEGGNTFAVRGIGRDGEPGRPDRYRWTLDTVAPVVTLRSAVVVYTPGDGATCSVEDEPFDCEGPAPPTPAGTEYFIATNGLGLSWTFDPMPPDLRFSGVGDPSTPGTSTLTLTFDVEDDDATILCTVDEASTPCAEPSIVDTITADDAGSHTTQIVATDRAGNPSPPMSLRWTFAIQSIG